MNDDNEQNVLSPESAESAAREPDGDFSDAVESQSRWPMVVGTIALLYGIGGMLCQGTMAVGSLFSNWLMALAPWDTSHIKIPLQLRIIGIGSQVPVVILGIVLIVSAINLIRRRRSSVKGLKVWAVLRLVMVFIGFGIGLFLTPANIDIQRQMNVAMNDWARREGETRMMQEFDEDNAWRLAVISQAAFAGVACIFPLFIGFYLSRRKITEEVSTWP